MTYAIEVLKTKVERLDAEVRANEGIDGAAIQRKIEVEEALKWLAEIQRLKLSWRTSCVVEVDCGEHGYSRLRLMVDNETDNREWWTELILDNADKNLKLSAGDVLILRRQ